LKNDACVVIEADLVKEIAVKDKCLFHLCLHYFPWEILQFHFYTVPFSTRYFTISLPFSIRYFAIVFPVEKKIVHALIFNALLDINHVILVIYHAFLELFACFGFLLTVKKSELLSVKLFQMKNVRIPLNFSKSNPSFIYVLHFDLKRVETCFLHFANWLRRNKIVFCYSMH